MKIPALHHSCRHRLGPGVCADGSSRRDRAGDLAHTSISSADLRVRPMCRIFRRVPWRDHWCDREPRPLRAGGRTRHQNCASGRIFRLTPGMSYQVSDHGRRRASLVDGGRRQTLHRRLISMRSGAAGSPGGAASTDRLWPGRLGKNPAACFATSRTAVVILPTANTILAADPICGAGGNLWEACLQANKNSLWEVRTMDRRQLITRSGAALAALGSGTAPGVAGAGRRHGDAAIREWREESLVKYPQKRPMISLTSRPPQLETPFSVFDESVITPNDAFFVRYHLADIPYDIDPDVFSVEIKGKVDKPTRLSLADIRKMPSVELVAVNQCWATAADSSNRGSPATNSPTARWAMRPMEGVPLKAVLDIAGVQAGKQVVFGGMDGPVLDTAPDFAQGARYRSCPRWRGHAGLCDEQRRPAARSTAFHCG